MLKDALQNEPAPVVLQQRIAGVNCLDDDYDEPFPLLNTRWGRIALEAREEAEECIENVPGHYNAQPEELKSEREANMGKRRRFPEAKLLKQDSNIERDSRNFR